MTAVDREAATATVSYASVWHGKPRRHADHLVPLKPDVRMFPDPKGRKRDVTVRVMKFWGVGQHWHVSIREEDNPRLGHDHGAHGKDRLVWLNDAADEGAKGRYESFRLELWEDTVERVRKVLRAWKVTRRTHLVVGDGDVLRSRWYRRQSWTYAQQSD